ncbi:MAG: site-specific DNA-methyltransferase [Candidatus Neomarinimicrobiota bacterium]
MIRQTSQTPQSRNNNTKLELNRIYNRDCVAGMAEIPDGSIDLIITDPPFAINFKARRSNYHRTQSRVLEGYNEIKPSDYLEFSLNWMTQAYRILKESGSLYVFSGWNNLKEVLMALDQTGFITVNHLIWQYQFGVVTKRRFVSSHYHCLYVCKNERLRKFFPYKRFAKEARDLNGRSLHYRDKEDVWQIKREYWTGKAKTPTKLPAEIIRKILTYSSAEDDIICDPFLGSGQVAVVSQLLRRQFIGFEINAAYYEFALKRIAETVSQSGDLFAGRATQ